MVGNISVKTLMTPFHTPGHVCFFVDHDGDRAVFTGDTLFVGGCGNLNDGTKDQLHSAFRKLGTHVCINILRYLRLHLNCNVNNYGHICVHFYNNL